MKLLETLTIGINIKILGFNIKNQQKSLIDHVELNSPCILHPEITSKVVRKPLFILHSVEIKVGIAKNHPRGPNNNMAMESYKLGEMPLEQLPA